MRVLFVVSALVILAVSAPQSVADSCSAADHVHTKQEQAEKYFDQMDLNNDQVVDRSEFEKSQTSTMIRSFDELQPDETGVVPREAFIDTFLRAHSEA